MADNLPRDILTSTAVYLSPKSLSACLRVCRSWHVAFIPALYSIVNIRSLHQLRLFAKTLYRAEKLNTLGHLVRTLKLTFAVDLDDISLELFLRLCPFLVEFDTMREWLPAHAAIFQKWKYLKKMPRLECWDQPPNICLGFFQQRITRLTVTCINYSEWRGFVTDLPCLEELEIHFVGPSAILLGAEISATDLETLHNSLPCLHSLTLECFRITGEMPKHIRSNDTVRELDLVPKEDRLWGEYFARKYTNLERLKLHGKQIHEGLTPEFMKLARSCRNLKWYDTMCQCRLSRSIYRQFMKIIHQIGAPMAFFHVDEWDIPLYTAMVNGFHRTISEVELFLGRHVNLEEYLEPLKYCLSLADLELCCQQRVELDRIWSYFRHVKTLALGVQTICLGNNSTTSKQYNVRKLILEGGDIEDQVFPYLSQHCTRLSSLRCHYRSNCPRSGMIDFPNQALNELLVKADYAYAFKLTRLDKTERIRERSRKYYGTIDESKIKGWTRWYYPYKAKGVDALRRLKPKEIQRLSDQSQKGDDGCRTKGSDSADIKPVISIQCHSIDDIYLNNAYVR